MKVCGTGSTSTNLAKTTLIAAATTMMFAYSAGASTVDITVQTFNTTGFQLATSNSVAVEDFEDDTTLTATFEGGGLVSSALSSDNVTNRRYGELDGSTAIQTSVGAFSTVANPGTGTGSTCRALSLDDSCTNIALQYDPDINGQGNIVPTNGSWSLNAADTKGMTWMATLVGNQTFNQLVFALRDPADQNATLKVTADGQSKSFSKSSNPGLFDNDDKQLFIITLDRLVTDVTVELLNSRNNDSFSLDGAAIGTDLSQIPLPAGGFLLLGGLGGLALLRRRKKAA